MYAVVGIALSLLISGTPWQHYALETEADVWDVTAADLNGDGVEDLIAYCSEGENATPEKSLAVFLGRPGGVYTSHPSFVHALPEENGTAFVAEWDGAAPEELVTASHAGARIYRLDAGTFAPVAEVAFASLFPQSTREPLFMRDVAQDLDGDERDEWLIPVAGGYEVWQEGEAVATVPAPIESELRDYGTNYMVTHRLPAVHSFELAGERLRGLAFLNATHADFAYGDQWSRHTRYEIPQQLREDWDSSTDLRDINADGLPDLLVRQTSGTVNLEVLTQVYLARDLFIYPDMPDAEFRSKGSFTTSALIDVNGDERLDLVLVSVPLGFKNILNYFFRNKVEVQVDVHLYSGEGFGQRPSMDTEVTVEAPEGRERVAYSMGDFDGDGRVDAAIGLDAGELAVYRGVRDDFLTHRPWFTLEIPTFGVARRADLNGNGNDDLVLHHPSGPHQKRIDVIVF